jgi:hypothetical protein
LAEWCDVIRVTAPNFNLQHCSNVVSPLSLTILAYSDPPHPLQKIYFKSKYFLEYYFGLWLL